MDCWKDMDWDRKQLEQVDLCCGLLGSLHQLDLELVMQRKKRPQSYFDFRSVL